MRWPAKRAEPFGFALTFLSTFFVKKKSGKDKNSRKRLNQKASSQNIKLMYGCFPLLHHAKRRIQSRGNLIKREVLKSKSLSQEAEACV